METLKKFINSPIGPKTTHFWGPVANWGIVIAGLSELRKDPERISWNMTAALAVYSATFMRFAWRVQPRNLLLLACHVCNEGVQLTQLYRKYEHEQAKKKAAAAAPPPPPPLQ